MLKAIVEVELSDVVHKIFGFKRSETQKRNQTIKRNTELLRREFEFTDTSQEFKDAKEEFIDEDSPQFISAEEEIAIDKESKMLYLKDSNNCFKPTNKKYLGTLSLEDAVKLVNESNCTQIDIVDQFKYLADNITQFKLNLSIRLNYNWISNIIGYEVKKIPEKKIYELLKNKNKYDFDKILPGEIIITGQADIDEKRIRLDYLPFGPVIGGNYKLFDEFRNTVKNNPFQCEKEGLLIKQKLINS